MADREKKGITVKIDAALHAEVSQYLETHGMTMAEFVTQALENELHPKHQTKEQNNMGNMRTVAFQVPEDLFQKIKDYLLRNNMTQKEFILGLIEDELEREQTERDSLSAEREDFPVEDEGVPDEGETAAADDFEAVCEDGKKEEFYGENEVAGHCDDTADEGDNPDESDDEDESEDEETGFSMQM